MIMTFNFDDHQQTIMGVKIKDPQKYRVIAHTMLFNVYEGWQPDVGDVKRAIKEYDQPAATTIEHLNEVYKHAWWPVYIPKWHTQE